MWIVPSYSSHPFHQWRSRGLLTELMCHNKRRNIYWILAAVKELISETDRQYLTRLPSLSHRKVGWKYGDIFLVFPKLFAVLKSMTHLKHYKNPDCCWREGLLCSVSSCRGKENCTCCYGSHFQQRNTTLCHSE